MAIQWSFATLTFPIADSPVRGGSGDWNFEEKLIEQDPLMANVTILTSWGRKSARRTITGTCSESFRDSIRSLHTNATVGTLTDAEGRALTARIVRADFSTMLPSDRYNYSIEFLER